MKRSAYFSPSVATTFTHADLEQALLEPFTHISSVPGKDIRGSMLASFNLWLNVPEDKLRIISKVISMLHTASLVYVVRSRSAHSRTHHSPE